MDTLISTIKNDNITIEDIRKLYTIMEREKILSSYNFPSKPSPDGYYYLWIKDKTQKGGRKQIKAKSLDRLKEKVYDHHTKQNIHTFRRVFKLVQEDKLKYVKNEEKVISVKNTIDRNTSLYNRFIAGSKIELMDLKEISKEDLEEFFVNILSTFDIKSKEFLNLRTNVNSVFKYAYGEYWIIDNPYDRINFKKYSDMLMKQTPVNKRKHSDEEINKILSVLHEKQISSPLYMPAYALELQIYMGLRRGEIPPLQWGDIKSDHIEIYKEQLTTKTKGIVKAEEFVIVHHTKNHKDRYFPITSKLDDFLCRLRSVHEKYHLNTPFLFPDNTPNGCINNNVVYGFYARICNDQNIPRSREFIKGPHSFRRNAITNTINNGGNSLIASKLYGNTPNVAEDNYYTGIDISSVKQLLDKG